MNGFSYYNELIFGGAMRPFRIQALAIFSIILFLSTFSFMHAQKQSEMKPKGTRGNRVQGKWIIPTPTEQGIFTGTWFYIDRNMRFVFFIKEEDGIHKIKIRWEMGNDESFETDWDGKCLYKFRGYDGIVNLEISNPNDRNNLKGKWKWQYLTDTVERVEQSEIEIYRSENGRKLVWLLPDFERIIKKGDNSRRYAYENMHILRKVSDRIIDWEDIPF